MKFVMEMSSELKELLQAAHHIQKMEKGMYLFQEGSSANELFIIQSGKVQVSKVIPDGRELTLRMCSKGDIVGELSLFTPSPKYSSMEKLLKTER